MSLNELQSFWDSIKSYFFFGLIGGMGGVITLLGNPYKKITFRAVLKVFFVSFGAGLIAGFYGKGQGYNFDMQYFLAGAAGIAAALSLAMVFFAVLRKFGIDVSAAIRDVRALDRLERAKSRRQNEEE